MPQREIVLGEKSRQYGSIDEFVKSASWGLFSGTHVIGSELPIIISWVERNSPVTFVTFSAALTKNSAPTVPIFSGRRTTAGLSANVLMISDPSLILDNRMMLSWYAGNALSGGIQTDISRIISTVSGDRRFVLFGASGGGFAALEQATRLNDSVTLVINPQTDITKYPYFNRYKELAWGIDPRWSGEPLPIKTEVISSYAEPGDSKTIYVQNTGDAHHFHDHMLPFRDAISAERSVVFVERDLGSGHFGPDAKSMTRLFHLATEIEDWEELKIAVSTENLLSVKK